MQDKWFILMRIILLIFVLLVSCAPVAQDLVTKQIDVKEPEVQDTVEPVKEPVQEPVVEPEVPQEVESPEVTQPPEPEQQLSLEEKCIQGCENSCEESSIIACRQKERSQCKSLCGTIIDPSACTQA